MAVSGSWHSGVTMADQILERFSPPTARWFRQGFAEPTPAQTQAWDAISHGQHTLVVAPTGSGKTLAAFLWAIDSLASNPAPEDPVKRCRVLYVSPLKALAVDIERNLRAPLTGIGHAARAMGEPVPDIRVAVRSGDTTPQERRAFATKPSDILITTPESLFLLLTSQARDALSGIETVIIDEIHAVADTKRGAHLAVSLERLDDLLPAPAQRIGLSATVRPVEEVSRFLAGGRPVTVISPPISKTWELEVSVPVPDMADLGGAVDNLAGKASGDPQKSSIWPHVEEKIVDLVAAHTSTIVFVNSRAIAEKVTARLNEIWWERTRDPDTSPAIPVPDTSRPFLAPPSTMIAAASTGYSVPATLAKAHHGSVSRELRSQIEEDLKSGRLPAVVATSSLELGIDMGAVDLVIQVEAPFSVAAGLQRVGRAGHQIGAVSQGVFFPKFRGDLVQTAVIVERMRSGDIEHVRVPENPLDVLAQQLVAMVAMDTVTVSDAYALIRRAAPFHGVTTAVFQSVLDMVSGRYPSDEFGALRPRIVWDRATDELTPRKSAQRLAVTSGGTIPDRGLFGVFLAGAEGPGKRVGELDEEMVYESRVGDVFGLGTSSWRIEEITHDRVLVTPAPGVAARLPFWHGDGLGRPAELGAAIGQFLHEVSTHDPDSARERIRSAGLDEWATDNLLTYVAEQKEVAGRVPTDTHLVVERFRDELGDWQLVVHSPYGSRVHAPWALVVAARLRERFRVDVHPMHADDGMVFRLPDMDWGADPADDDDPAGRAADLSALDDELFETIFGTPTDILTEVTDALGGSALFASRFRECAGRALLLPRRYPGQRQALWQQRQRAAQLLQVASDYPDFPIVLEAVRECVNDVFDVPALVDVLHRIASRQISVTTVETPHASPFASSLLFGYIAQFMYDGDAPLAEKRAAALSLDPQLLADLLGTSESLALSELLDPDALTATEEEMQFLTASRRARDPDDLSDILRMIGPLQVPDLAARCAEPEQTGQWLEQLEAAGRVWRLGSQPVSRWAVVEDAGRLRDGLGVPLPVGVPHAFTEPVPDALVELVARYARTHATFTVDEVAAWLQVPAAVAKDAVRRLIVDERIVEGDLRPAGWVPPGPRHPLGDSTGPWGRTHYCDATVLRLLRRRSLAALRNAIEPVTALEYARFLPSWQGIGAGAGVDGLARAIEQLAGAIMPASAVESFILPARVADYSPAMLDELTSSGEIVWQGHGRLAGGDGWVSVQPADVAEHTCAPPGVVDERAQQVWDALSDSGGFFFRSICERVPDLDEQQVQQALWDLVWAGVVTNDTFAPVRAHAQSGTTTHRRTPAPPRGRYGSFSRAAMPRRTSPPDVVGRWSVIRPPSDNPTTRAAVTADVLLDRYGVVTRGSVVAEDIPGGFAAIYRVLATAEEAGRIRRGYFVEGLGAAQFGSVGAIDRLRADTSPGNPSATPQPQVFAACDPANPFGAALPWPPRPRTVDGRGHQPARKAGALVVVEDGAVVLYLERGGRTVLTWTDDPATLQRAAGQLADLVHRGVMTGITIERIDGQDAVGSKHVFIEAVSQAGFRLTPRGMRLRR